MGSQLKQQLVLCLQASLRPHPVIVAAGSSKEDTLMLQEATVGVLVLSRRAPGAAETAAAATRAGGTQVAGTGSLAPGDSESKLPFSKQGSMSFCDASRASLSSILPLLPEHEPASGTVPAAANSLWASAKQLIHPADIGLCDHAKQSPLSRQQLHVPPTEQQQQQSHAPRLTRANIGRSRRILYSRSSSFEAYLQAACLFAGSSDVILGSFESLRNLMFRHALFEEAQMLLLLDQVVYSTSLLSTFLFALLLTNLLDLRDPTSSVYCIWFSVLAVTASCLIGRPMCLSLDNEVRSARRCKSC